MESSAKKKSSKRPVRDCAIPDCGPQKIRGRDWCSKHYMRWYVHGDPLFERPAKNPECSVEDCSKPNTGGGYCNTHYSRWRLHGDPLAHAKFYSTGSCHIEGCAKVPRGRYCTTHRSRMERYGKPDLPPRPDHRTHQMGYILVLRRGHPMAQKSGHVMEHRAVLYDSIGPGEHPCTWCGKAVEWKTGPVKGRSLALVVDHLDSDRTNNELSNLVPSCSPCNSARASAWGRNWRDHL